MMLIEGGFSLSAVCTFSCQTLYRLFADQRYWTRNFWEKPPPPETRTKMRIKESVWVYLCTCFVLMFKSIKKKPVTLWIVVTSFFFCGDLTPGRAVPCSWHFGFMSQIFSPANRCLVNESPETFLTRNQRKKKKKCWNYVPNLHVSACTVMVKCWI